MEQVLVGTPLFGFCEGRFGRDSYRDKRIEAVGYDWIVARNEGGEAEFVSFVNTAEMVAFVERCSNPELTV